MSNKILKKCLDELSQEKPNLDYIRGMLEAWIETQPQRDDIVHSMPTTSMPTALPSTYTGMRREPPSGDAETDTLNNMARANVAKMRNIALQSGIENV